MKDFVQTVKGIIKKDCLGIIDSHCHLWIEEINSGYKKKYSKFIVNDFSIIKKELNKLKNEEI